MQARPRSCIAEAITYTSERLKYSEGPLPRAAHTATDTLTNGEMSIAVVFRAHTQASPTGRFFTAATAASKSA